MIGPIVNSGALAAGGIIGALLGQWIPTRVKETLPLIFGVVTLSLGAIFAAKAVHLPVVVLSLIIGTFIGELLYLERGLGFAIRKGMYLSRKHGVADDGVIAQLISLVAVMCFGSMGIFGAINEGISKVPDVLITKAVLDLFSGMIFGASLGIRVSFIAVPQFVILAACYLSAGLIMPLVTDVMLNDFSACGGIIFLAAGLRMCGIKDFPVINMLPAILIVLPLSWRWSSL